MLVDQGFDFVFGNDVDLVTFVGRFPFRGDVVKPFFSPAGVKQNDVQLLEIVGSSASAGSNSWKRGR